VNRHHRRAQARRQAKAAAGIRAVRAASEADGKPWTVYGLTEACRDCGAEASMHGQGINGAVSMRVYHDDGCPASLGVTSWQPVPL
jgi:hypothetical protein